MRKSKKRSLAAVNSPQVNQERTFRVNLFVESFYFVFQKYILRQGFKLSLVLFILDFPPNFRLVFLQIVFMKKEYKSEEVEALFKQ